jgi:hypothetical protein
MENMPKILATSAIFKNLLKVQKQSNNMQKFAQSGVIKLSPRGEQSPFHLLPRENPLFTLEERRANREFFIPIGD